MSNDGNERENLQHDLADFVNLPHIINDNIRKIIEKLNETDETVLLIGMNGVGKTTVLNYIANNELKVKIIHGKSVLNCDDTNYIMGHSNKSETLFPNFYSLGKTLYIDLPGFEDNHKFLKN